MKRILSVLLVLCMLCSLLPAGVMPASAGGWMEDFTWDEATATLTIHSMDDPYGYLSGADALWNAENAIPYFEYRDVVEQVVIGSGVEKVLPYSLYKFSNLRTVVMEEGATEICSAAFAYCTALESISIADSVTSIDESAFEYCSNLTSVTIPNGVAKIGSFAFWYCTSLTGMTIPDSVTSIGSFAFCDCSSLTGIWVDENNSNYSNDEKGVLFNKYKTKLIQCPGGYIGDYIVPNSVTSIGDSAFGSCSSLTSVTIPDSVASIGDSAFWGSSLNGITIPNSVTSIGSSAFESCTSLTSVTIPDSVTSIGSSTFSGCTSLNSITIPNSVTSIGSSAFSGCTSLSSITIPNSVTSIGSSAFWGCTGLNSITIPNSVTSIGSSAFSGCTSLSSITIPNSVTSIGSSTFWGCTGLNSITIPNNVTSIGFGAFSGCTSLSSITIPGSVTSIGSSVFWGCTSLTGIWVDEENPNYSNDEKGVLFNKDKTELLQCPGGYTGDYTVPNSVISIGDFAFRGCSSLTNVTSGNGVTSIGSSAFESCTSLTGVTIPDSVTSIGDYAFAFCNNLTSMTISDSLTSIGSFAFWCCTSLTALTIPDSVTSIGSSAFWGCTSLIGIWVDENHPNYSNDEKGVLFNKNKTELIQCPGGYVGDYTVPNSVTSICSSAFWSCSSLASVTIPDSVTSIGDEAFWYCTSLQSVCFLGDAPMLGERAFQMWDEETQEDINIPGLTLYFIDVKEGWISPTWNGYPTATWDGVNIPHSHSYQAIVTAPTCTEKGYTTHTCTVCGDSYVDTYVDALGHNFGEWTQEKAPTCTEKGAEKRACSRCDTFETREIDALGHKYENGVCVQCGEKDPNEQPTIEFVDVPQKAWYVEAVNYAVRNGLMNGVGNDQFNPEGSMTRAMLVTVLWRYEGEPEAGENTFSDVPNGQWYTNAVAWAAENGIVGGVGNNRFDPNGEITREQMATILFRYAEKKGIDTSKRGSLNIFSDEKQLSAYAKDAVQWAVAEQIINGSDGKLLPQGSATRAQVATILMRFIENIVKK